MSLARHQEDEPGPQPTTGSSSPPSPAARAPPTRDQKAAEFAALTPSLMSEPLNAFVAYLRNELYASWITSRIARASSPSGNFSLPMMYSANASHAAAKSSGFCAVEILARYGFASALFFWMRPSASFRRFSASARSILTSGSVSYALAAALNAVSTPRPSAARRCRSGAGDALSAGAAPTDGARGADGSLNDAASD